MHAAAVRKHLVATDSSREVKKDSIAFDERFFWIGMSADVEHHIAFCRRCCHCRGRKDVACCSIIKYLSKSAFRAYWSWLFAVRAFRRQLWECPAHYRSLYYVCLSLCQQEADSSYYSNIVLEKFYSSLLISWEYHQWPGKELLSQFDQRSLSNDRYS